jgi:pimeloyl-ACP methyl ester carboxylesterase
VLSVNKIGVNDNFFNLGGNSLAVIQLIENINLYYSTDLRVIDGFTSNTIALMAQKLSSCDNHRILKKINNSENVEKIFMIHPSRAGCEVYIGLANKMTSVFSCYGIDNYNLHRTDKINSLYELADYYLQEINNVQKPLEQNTYHILGWSFGGKIATQIAYILEQRGIKNIKLYLLDTLIYDEYLISLEENLGTQELDYVYQEYTENYKNKLILDAENERRLILQPILGYLSYTKIILLKAGIKKNANNKQYRKFYNYLHTCIYNNIDMIVDNIDQISLVNINTDHHNIVNSEYIISEIIKFAKL